MRTLTRLVSCAAIVVAASAPAQTVGRHVFDVAQSGSAFTFSGNVTFSGINGPIVGNPSTFNVSGQSSMDVSVAPTGIVRGQLLPGNGTIVTIPTLNAFVPNPLPFLPPLVRISVTGTTAVFRSVDVASGNPASFAIQPNGSFSAGVVASVLSGTATVTGLVNQTINLAGNESTPQTVNGTLTAGPNGLGLTVAISATLSFSDPVTGTSGSLNLVGNLAASDQRFASDVTRISSTAGGTQVMRLSAGTTRANATYLVLASASGTTPGLNFGSVNLPLNYDAFMDLSLVSANTFPYAMSLGTLDARGLATASITVPALPTPLNLQLHHAYALLNGPTVLAASNPIVLSLTP